MDIKKVFLDNRYSRMSEIIGEGSFSGSEESKSLISDATIRGDDLVVKTPQIHNPPCKADYDGLKALTSAILAKMDDKEEDVGPSGPVIYQEVRSCGPIFNSIVTQVKIGEIGRGIEDGEVCRKSKYYTSMRELGCFFYRSVPVRLQCFEALPVRVTYGIFSVLDEDKCSGLGAGEYSIEYRVQVLVDPNQQGARRTALWSESHLGVTRYFNSKCQDVMSESSIKVEDIMTALGLPRENSGLSSSDIMRIRNYMQMGVTGSTTLRFTVMYLILLRMWHSGNPSVILNMDNCRNEAKDFSSKGISECLNSANRGTVINVVNMDNYEQSILLRSVFGYTCGDFLDNGFDFYLGGFNVPAEVSPTGVAYLLGASRSLTGKVKVTSDQIYATMVKYAMLTQSCEEMEMGFVLACSFIYGDGVPNISVPRPQGYVDVVATALSKVNTDGFVPPYKVDEMAVLGVMVTTRQQILMATDIVMNSDPSIIEETVSILRLPHSARQGLYCKYAKERFSDAFGVCSITDPLLMQHDDQVSEVRDVPFPSVAWSAINNDVLVKGTLSEYFIRGEWVRPDQLDTLDVETRNKVKTTYLANGLLELPETRGIKVIKYNAMRPIVDTFKMEPGKCSTKVIDFDYVHKLSKAKNALYSPKTFEIQEAVVLDYDVEFIGDNPHEPRGASTKVVKACLEVMAKLAAAEDRNQRNAGATSSPNTSSKLSDEIVVNDDSALRSSTTSGFQKGVDSFTELATQKKESTEDLPLPVWSRIRLIDTPQSVTVKAVVDYMSKKNKCYETSYLGRLTHLLGRICPEQPGTTCALRSEMKLLGFRKDMVREWQVCAKIVKHLAPKFADQGLITLHDMHRWLGLSESVERHGRARSVFYLTYLPSYNVASDLLKSWRSFLAGHKIKVLYNGKELGMIKDEKFGGEQTAEYLELMELTRNMMFPNWKELATYWQYVAPSEDLCPGITKEESRSILVMLKERCKGCVS